MTASGKIHENLNAMIPNPVFGGLRSQHTCTMYLGFLFGWELGRTTDVDCLGVPKGWIENHGLKACHWLIKLLCDTMTIRDTNYQKNLLNFDIKIHGNIVM